MIIKRKLKHSCWRYRYTPPGRQPLDPEVSKKSADGAQLTKDRDIEAILLSLEELLKIVVLHFEQLTGEEITEQDIKEK